MKDAHMKDLRERLHMTQAQLAEALGISTRTVATYEAGAEPPKAIRLACRWIEHEATANAPAPDDDLTDEQPADYGGPAWRYGVEERLTALEARLSALEAARGKDVARSAMRPMPAPSVEQRIADYCTPAEIAACIAADAEDGVPDGTTLRQRKDMIRKGTMPKPLSAATTIVQTQQPSDGSRPWGTYRPPELTPDEEADEMRSRAIAKARTLAAGEPWE